MELENLIQSNLTADGTLDLEAEHLGDESVSALAKMEIMKKVNRLELGDNDISNVGVVALSASPHLQNLKTLNLKSNKIE